MIFTLTLNPCLDNYIYVDKLLPDDTIRASKVEDYPAGKGIDVSRVIHELGGKTACVAPLGGETGEKMLKRLQKDGIITIPVWIDYNTRTNTFIQTPYEQYRISVPGSSLTEDNLSLIHSILIKFINSKDTLVISGSLPPNVNKNYYFSVISNIKNSTGCKIYLDADGEALAEGIKASPFLIKPNLYEFERLIGKTVGEDTEMLKNEALKLINRYFLKYIIISMGKDGALLVSETESYKAETVKVKSESAVGAGDSFLAAFVYYHEELKTDIITSLKAGSAAGAATAMTPGTQLCRKKDFLEIYERIKSYKV